MILFKVSLILGTDAGLKSIADAEIQSVVDSKTID